MYELPPILKGSSAQQIAALRDYLVRMARQLNEAGQAPAESVQAVSVSAGGKRIYSGSPDTQAQTEAVRKNANELKALIIKTSRELGQEIDSSGEEARIYADGRLESIFGEFLSRSEFGSFTENVESQIASTARGVVESYGYLARIESNQKDIGLLQSYMTELDGQIRRGVVTDPMSGEEVMGIAISQSLRFTGEVKRGEDGVDYYRLASGQTFGLYTSTGWQFWIDGCRKGWYNSMDGMLHIANVAVEDSMQLGGWQLSSLGGLGLRYTGG